MGKYYESSEGEEQEQKEPYKFPEYTNQELWALNNLLKEKYGDGNKIDDITRWLQDEGALSKDGSIIVTGYHLKRNRKGDFWFPYHDYPTKYQLCQDKLEKASKLLGRKEFAVKKELEELEKGMKLEINEFDRPEILKDEAEKDENEIKNQDKIF